MKDNKKILFIKNLIFVSLCILLTFEHVLQTGKVFAENNNENTEIAENKNEEANDESVNSSSSNNEVEVNSKNQNEQESAESKPIKEKTEDNQEMIDLYRNIKIWVPAPRVKSVTLYIGIDEKFDPNSPLDKVYDEFGTRITDHNFFNLYNYWIDNKSIAEHNRVSAIDTTKVRSYLLFVFVPRVGWSNKVYVRIRENQTKLELQDVELYQGKKFDPNMPFKNVTDKAGKKIKAEDFKYYYIYPEGQQVGNEWLTKELDTKEPGTYKVRVYYPESEEYSNEATITVKEDKTKLELQDVELYQGKKFDPNMPFKNVTDKDGNKVKAEDFKYYYIYPEGQQVGDKWLTKELDTKEPGIYKVRLYDPFNEEYSNEATITVKEDKTKLELQDVDLYQGDKFEPNMPFKNVTDKDGNKLKAEDFKYYYIYPEGQQVEDKWLTKELDTKEPGIYKVRVFHIESNEYSNVATITVKEDKTKLELQDVNLYQGEKFDPNMPFKNVTDKDGNKIKAEDFKYYYIYPDGKQVGSDWLTKELDTKEPGIYKVRVFHIESREYSNVSTVTIKEDKSSLKTKDLTVDVEQKISWKEGFSSATDENGKDIPWSDKRISIEGVPNKETNIDTSKPGVYEYTLIFKGKAKNTKAKFKVTVQEKLSAEGKPQTLSLGASIDRLNPKDFVKNVKKGNEEIKPDDYTVEIKETVKEDVIGNKKMIVTVVRSSTGEKVDVSVPVKVEWGRSSVAYGALGDTRTSAAFPLILGENPIIAAVSGLEDDNKPIHTSFEDLYYQFDWFDLSKTTTITMDETKRGQAHIEAKGVELKQDTLKKWGTDQKQSVQYGDIVRAWQREPTKNYLYENEERNRYNNDLRSVYYEITKDGYQPLRVNQLKPKKVSTVLHASGDTLNEDFKNNMNKYFDSNEIKNIKPVEFVNLPDTGTSGLKSARVRVEETLKTGKKVQYDYDIEVNVENKWVNVTIPTKMLFFSDMKSENKDKVISESYSVTNNSDNTSLEVEMTSFSVEKDSEVTYLSAKEKDPTKPENKLRLNLFVNDQPKVQSLNGNTKAIHLVDLDFKTSTKLRFDGKYFNANSEASPQAKSSMVLKFNIKE
ncbi:hypothetical protein BCR23_13260 [Enterococcus quebecensis]|uniref:Ig-like domain-containing protein n=2 Tax=Enterococcus quebecensis TaxID=903983 RepID=A0A1E5H1V3_9ENTE|nr:bacterial Ig-like domain-containing protein [Enterococcus quebecensis]OEG18901.1 hypothetical protein BCR23_13260 [Enterococcus quebecensis]